MVGLGGLEPPTSPLSGARSSHLSYRPNLLAGNILRDSLLSSNNSVTLRLASGRDQKSANTSGIQTLNSGHFSISERMSIAGFGARRFYGYSETQIHFSASRKDLDSNWKVASFIGISLSLSGVLPVLP